MQVDPPYQTFWNSLNSTQQKKTILILDAVYQACMTALRRNVCATSTSRKHIEYDSSSVYPRLPAPRLDLDDPTNTPGKILQRIAYMKNNPGRGFKSWMLQTDQKNYYNFDRMNRGYKFTQGFTYSGDNKQFDSLGANRQKVISLVEGYRCLIMVPLTWMAEELVKSGTIQKQNMFYKPAGIFPAAHDLSEEELCKLESVLYKRWIKIWMLNRNLNKQQRWQQYDSKPYADREETVYIKAVYLICFYFAKKTNPLNIKANLNDPKPILEQIKAHIKDILGRPALRTKWGLPGYDAKMKPEELKLPAGMDNMASQCVGEIVNTRNIIPKQYYQVFYNDIMNRLRQIPEVKAYLDFLIQQHMQKTTSSTQSTDIIVDD